MIGTKVGYSQLDNVGVPKQLQISNFPLDPPSHVPVDQFLPRNDLQGDLLTRNLVDGELDLAERALTEGFYDGVLPHASLWISSFWASILTRVRVLTVAVGMVRTVGVGRGLGVLGRVLLLLCVLLLWRLWLLLLVIVAVIVVVVVVVVVVVMVVVVVLLGGWWRSTVRIVGAVLTTVCRNGEFAFGVGLRHDDKSIGTAAETRRDGMGYT